MNGPQAGAAADSEMAAAARVADFLDVWQSNQTRDEIIYGLGVVRNGSVHEPLLTVSDLRTLLQLLATSSPTVGSDHPSTDRRGHHTTQEQR